MKNVKNWLYVFLILVTVLLCSGCSEKLPDAFGVYLKKDGKFRQLPRFETSVSINVAAKMALEIEPVSVTKKDELFFYQEGIAPTRIELVNAMTVQKLTTNIQPSKKPGMYVIKLESLSAGKYFIFVLDASGMTDWCWGTVQVD